MELTELKQTVTEHSGVFHCVGRSDESRSKQVTFEHSFDPPGTDFDIPDTGLLREFYSTFGNLALYHHEESGDAAFYLANPEQWESLREYFFEWLEYLDEEEFNELVPGWVKGCITIGEIPSSGNYLLMPTEGDLSGHVLEFEHDGFEFIELGSNIGEFVLNMLSPDSKKLTGIASHMTFIEGDSMDQWWISEMKDNKGNVVKTES